MGDVNHGYLGMILAPKDYFCIAPTGPFTRPPNLGVLIPNPAGTAAQIASTEDTHHLTEKLYLETLFLEQTFIPKIIEAISNKYLATLRNRITGKITPLVPTILESCTTTMDASTDNKFTTRKPPPSQ